MPLTKLQFRPGINRETTSYTNEGGWFDGDKIRFRAGMPEKIGGWTRKSASSFLGTCRIIFPWVTLDTDTYLGIGTHLKYYVERGGGFNDITPLRLTARDPLNQTVMVFSVAAVGAVGSMSVDQDATVTVSGVQGTAAFGVVSAVPTSPSLLATGLLGSVLVTTTDSDLEVVTNDASVTVSGVSASAGLGNVVVAIPATDVSVAVSGVSAALTGASSAASAQTQTDLISFTATDGQYRVLVTHVDHGAVVNDFVTFSGNESLGGNITADVLNQEYQIVEVVDTNSYYIEARQAGTSIESITVDGQLSPTYVTATASDTGDGGIYTIAAYQINTGLNTVVFGLGWGSGTWSRGTWGSPSNEPVPLNELRQWSSDNFGEDLLLNPRDGGIYYWDKTSGLASRAVALSDLPGANAAPTVAKQVLVSDRDRHVLAFGCDGQGAPGVQDPLLIRFSDQESAADWAATATNTAGDLRLGSGSEIICAVETRQQIVVFTDTTLYAMQFLGPPFTFGATSISENITIQGPRAAVAVGDAVFWMGKAEFYVYGGTVERLPCTVRDYVFNSINEDQAAKTFASLNSENSEVWWFYPSADSAVTDRYVVYNYLEKAWYYGSLTRTAWTDRGVLDLPIAASTDGYLYFHENGFDDGSTNPASPIEAYIQSSPVDIGEGDRFMFISRMLPDWTFRNSSNPTPTADITVDVRNFQRAGYTASSTHEISEDTTQLFFRLRGRQMRFKIASDQAGVTWRLGSPRLDIRQDGRR